MFVWDFIVSVLSWMGLFKKEVRLLLLGLDNAGKTTLLRMLEWHNGTAQPYLSTWFQLDFFFVEEITIGKLKLVTFDIGGHQQACKVWRDYYPAVNALVFVIDACDKQHLPESKLELDLILSDELLKYHPVLILGNKVDLPGAASKQQLFNDLGLNYSVSGKDKTTHSQLESHPVELYMCSILNRHGYEEGFEWLCQYID
ncbi:hypothetical protein DAPPUDRAFT_127286 [Daphnia pulex]|uniref:small monomeric GTPase n=1 Tax=Daphnia pulex TaxID=6669 RepID=E9FZJ5_DAPPU|nr:hypothetical protein DAPPUDRAFT_127286 [Daphnia pulex]|eukprot:EFX87255.1 hypothetical protein DAPPUDRAFT_127286 [Daphnia pulex]